MEKDRTSIHYLLLATGISLVLWYIPYADYLVYPFKLFVTFIHEGGHALAALLTFGTVDQIRINRDTSGVTLTMNGSSLIIASAGYLSSTVYGALLLLLGRNRNYVKAGLGLTAALVLGLTLIFIKGFFGWVAGLVIATGIIFFAAMAKPGVAHFFLSFLAVQCCLNAIFDLKTLFDLSLQTGEPSDAMNMQRLTFIPAVVWALLWIGLSLLVLFFALKRYLQKSEKFQVEI